MKSHEENRQPLRPDLEAPLPVECRREEECQDHDEALPFPIAPPPMPWPRVFPGL